MSAVGCRERIISIDPLLHPSIFFGQAAKVAGLEGYSSDSFPSNDFQLLMGDPEAFPGQMG